MLSECPVIDYVNMTLPEIKALERERTIFLMALSPVEVHGLHLPVGTDLFIAEEILRRYAVELNKEYPKHTLVRLPTLHLGADALPVSGSLSVPAPLVRQVLLSYVKSLAAMGFRYLFLADNHGGPRHNLASESAARIAWKKYRFHLVNPFNLEFKLMVQHDPDFLKKAGLSPGCCGDDADAHAGTNETSLMLAVDPNRVRDHWRAVSPSLPPPPSKTITLLARLAGIFSAGLERDLHHLAATMAWVKSRDMLPYMGAPALATPEAGEAMLQARIAVAMGLFRQALAGRPVKLKPMLWGLRVLHRLPE